MSRPRGPKGGRVQASMLVPRQGSGRKTLVPARQEERVAKSF